MTYSEKLKDPRWQKKRSEVLERDNRTCRICDCQKKNMHVHHCIYFYGKDPWEYDNKTLQTLCPDCHIEIEGHKEFIKKALAGIPLEHYNEIGNIIFSFMKSTNPKYKDESNG